MVYLGLGEVRCGLSWFGWSKVWFVLVWVDGVRCGLSWFG